MLLLLLLLLLPTGRQAGRQGRSVLGEGNGAMETAYACISIGSSQINVIIKLQHGRKEQMKS